jgi:ABC-type uncharacterized transport system auxiliary subunit
MTIIFRQGLALILGLVIIFITAACGLSRPYPVIRSFALEIPSANLNKVGKVKRPLLIQVTSGGASPQYETRKLVYKIGTNEFSDDFYSELVGLPSRLVADQLAAFLDNNSDRFRSTLGLNSSQSPELVLDVYLSAFHGDYTVNPPQAVVEVKVTLTDQRSSRPRNLWSKTYSGQQAVAETAVAEKAVDRPTGLTTSLGLALAPIFEEIKTDLPGALTDRK